MFLESFPPQGLSWFDFDLAATAAAGNDTESWTLEGPVFIKYLRVNYCPAPRSNPSDAKNVKLNIGDGSKTHDFFLSSLSGDPNGPGLLIPVNIYCQGDATLVLTLDDSLTTDDDGVSCSVGYADWGQKGALTP